MSPRCKVVAGDSPFFFSVVFDSKFAWYFVYSLVHQYDDAQLHQIINPFDGVNSYDGVLLALIINSINS